MCLILTSWSTEQPYKDFVTQTISVIIALVTKNNFFEEPLKYSHFVDMQLFCFKIWSYFEMFLYSFFLDLQENSFLFKTNLYQNLCVCSVSKNKYKIVSKTNYSQKLLPYEQSYFHTTTDSWKTSVAVIWYLRQIFQSITALVISEQFWDRLEYL